MHEQIPLEWENLLNPAFNVTLWLDDGPPTKKYNTYRTTDEESRLFLDSQQPSQWDMDRLLTSCKRLQPVSALRWAPFLLPPHPTHCKAGLCQRSIREDWDSKCICVSLCTSVCVHMLIGHGPIVEDWDPFAPRVAQATQPAEVYNQSNSVHPSQLTHTHTHTFWGTLSSNTAHYQCH